jgi:hypothetical protein
MSNAKGDLENEVFNSEPEKVTTKMPSEASPPTQEQLYISFLDSVENWDVNQEAITESGLYPETIIKEMGDIAKTVEKLARDLKSGRQGC